jgi:hypothetical protein
MAIDIVEEKSLPPFKMKGKIDALILKPYLLKEEDKRIEKKICCKLFFIFVGTTFFT